MFWVLPLEPMEPMEPEPMEPELSREPELPQEPGPLELKMFETERAEFPAEPL